MPLPSAQNQKTSRSFLPPAFVLTSWDDLAPWVDKLMVAPPQTEQQARLWLEQHGELDALLYEEKAWRYIRMTCHTDHAEYRESFSTFVLEISPRAAVASDQLNRVLADSPGFALLPDDEFLIVKRSVIAQIELFREENVPLMAAIQEESREFDTLASGLSIEVNGENITLPRATLLLESSDPAQRTHVWNKIVETRGRVADTLNTLYTSLVQKRTQVARNAGFDSFTDFSFRALGRFDYGRRETEMFHESVESAVKPKYLWQLNLRREKLELDAVRPQDQYINIFGKEPLKPFRGGDELLAGAAEVLHRLHPPLGKNLLRLKEMGHLDLESRLNKAPGGYNYSLPESGAPFIFMNAVGTSSDVVTMLHESGHAAHSFAMNILRVAAFRDLPSEIAELASMSMEFLTLDHWDVFYKDADSLKRARKEHLLRVFTLLPWVATIDCFQQWVYDHPGHTAEERSEEWKRIYIRFHGAELDWSDSRALFANLWHRQGHVFDVPFYYIEYGFALLGAIAVWRNYRRDPDKALAGYLSALSLGYTRPIPEVYAAAGVDFRFSREYVQELMDFLMEEYHRLG